MKKILLITFFLFSSFVFANENVELEKLPKLIDADKYGIHYLDNELTDINTRDRILLNPPLQRELMIPLSLNGGRCPNSHAHRVFSLRQELEVVDLITDYSLDPFTNRYTYECSKYFYEKSDSLNFYFTFLYRYNISDFIDKSIAIDTEELQRDKEMAGNFVYEQNTQAMLDKFRNNAFESVENRKDLSSYLTSVFTIDADTIDLQKSADFNRVVLKNGNAEEEQFYVTSKIGAAYKWIKNMQNAYSEIAQTIMLFAFASLGAALFFYIIKFKKNKESELELSKFASYFFVGLLSFTPYAVTQKEENVTAQTSYTNLASSTITAVYSMITIINNKVAYTIVDSTVDNMLQNAGLENQITINKLIEEKHAKTQELQVAKAFKTQCENTFENLDLSVNQFLNDNPSLNYIGNNKHTYHALQHSAWIKQSATRGVSRPLCAKTIPKIQPLEYDLKMIKERLEIVKKTDYKTNVQLIKLIENVYKDIQSDGFIALPNAFIQIMILERELNYDLYKKKGLEQLEKEIEDMSKYSKEGIQEYVAEKIPFLMMPGSDTVLNLVTNAIKLPIISTGVAVPMAVLYGELFLENLPIYVLYIVSMISFMLWFAVMFLYTCLTYVMFAIIFFPKNYEVMQRYFKAVFLHSLKSTILIISIFITYVLTEFVKNYSNFKSDQMLMNVYNALDNTGKFTPVPFSVSLLSSLMQIAGTLLSVILVYLLLTKGTAIIYEALSGEKTQTSDEMENVAEQKIKSKGM